MSKRIETNKHTPDLFWIKKGQDQRNFKDLNLKKIKKKNMLLDRPGKVVTF